jgi:hypothetical protein
LNQVRKLSLHEKQGAAFESEKKITLCCSGIQGGKTTVGVLWFLRQASRWVGTNSNFIIGTPSYKILNQSTLPTFLKFAEGLGTYHKVDQEFHFKSGPKIYFRTSTDPYSVEGIQDVRAIWLDEAGLCKYTFWVNLEGRAARTSAPIICTTTPYGMNWPYQQLIKPLNEGLRDDVAYFEWLSIDNPSFPLEEYERQKRLLDTRTFRRKYMGIHERMEGLVYELPQDCLSSTEKLPQGTRLFASVDWGFAEGHEFAVLVRAITLDGFRYEVDEFKASGLTPDQQIAACIAKKSAWNVEHFFCDPARPDMIAALNKAGGKAIGFHEGRANLKPLLAGITEHTRLTRSGKYKIWQDKCKHLLDEYETYHWPEYQGEREPPEAPVGIKDHLMDCARMMTVGTMGIVVREAKKYTLGMKTPHRDFFDPTKKSKSRASTGWDSN